MKHFTFIFLIVTTLLLLFLLLESIFDINNSGRAISKDDDIIELAAVSLEGKNDTCDEVLLDLCEARGNLPLNYDQCVTVAQCIWRFEESPSTVSFTTSSVKCISQCIEKLESIPEISRSKRPSSRNKLRHVKSKYLNSHTRRLTKKHTIEEPEPTSFPASNTVTTPTGKPTKKTSPPGINIPSSCLSVVPSRKPPAPTKPLGSLTSKPTTFPTSFQPTTPTRLPKSSPTRKPSPSPTSKPEKKTNHPTTSVPSSFPTNALGPIITSTPTQLPTSKPEKKKTKNPTSFPTTNDPVTTPTDDAQLPTSKPGKRIPKSKPVNPHKSCVRSTIP